MCVRHVVATHTQTHRNTDRHTQPVWPQPNGARWPRAVVSTRLALLGFPPPQIAADENPTESWISTPPLPATTAAFCNTIAVDCATYKLFNCRHF